MAGEKILEPYQSLLKYSPRGGLVLDAGCGSCEKASFLRKHQREIIGIDISIEPDYSQENILVSGSVENLPFKANSFDFIYCLSVLQFIKNDIDVIHEFYRVLKPEGKLLFTVPISRSVHRLIRDAEIACGVYRSPQFNVKDHHYYDKRYIGELIVNKFKLIEFHCYGSDFFRRFFLFFADIFYKYVLRRPALDTIQLKKIKGFASRFSHRNQTGNLSRQFQIESKPINPRNRLKNRFEFIYFHYIVIVEKMQS